MTELLNYDKQLTTTYKIERTKYEFDHAYHNEIERDPLS